MSTQEQTEVTTAPFEPAGKRFEGMSLCEVFQESVSRYGDRLALTTTDGSTSLTFREYGEAVRGVAGELHRRGIRDGDTVGLMIANRPEFYVMDSAVLHLGAAPYSIYLTLSPDQIAFQIENGKPSLIICDEDRLENVLAAGMERDRVIVLGDGEDSIESFVSSGREHEFDFEAGWRAVTPDHVATIIYTSGTTGDPKGVEITHLNALATAEAVNGALHFPDNSRVISYLPLAHVAERNNSHWMGMAFGFSVTTCTEPGKVAEHLPAVRPIWFFGVPRVFEKIKAASEASMDPETAAALERAVGQLPSRDIDPADRALLDVVRRDIGLDEAASVNVGAAPAVPELIDFYHAIGVELSELWGMSELCGSGTVNQAGAIRTGTAGPPMPGVEIRLAEDGEIQARCP
ncbi:MAG: AMP-binding protein, partial [Actinomycetota bacterium]|nr:AMP-binding protein [Actinomycetota bacterium]